MTDFWCSGNPAMHARLERRRFLPLLLISIPVCISLRDTAIARMLAPSSLRQALAACSRTSRRRSMVVRADASAAKGACQLRKLSFCVNTTCIGQGSEQIAQFVGGLGVEGLEVVGRECLGNCGNGPNALLESPGGDGKSGRQLSRLTTLEAAAQVLREHCGVDIGEKELKASDLRQAGGEAASRGDFEAAEFLFTEGLAANPSLGKHLLFMNRSEVRLEQGNAEGGLTDARAAAACAPPTFIFPYVLQVEALLQLGRHGEAQEALAAAVAQSPEFAQDDDYGMLLEAVQGGPVHEA